MHISNRHLRLAPIVARLAESQGLVAAPAGRIDDAELARRQERVALDRDGARRAADLGALRDDARWSPLVASASTPLWTDDFSNILSVLSVR